MVIFGVGVGSNTVLGFTNIAEQLLFSMLPSIMSLEFDLIGFLGPQWFIFGVGIRLKNNFLV